MTADSSALRLRGIVPPIVTPLAGRDSLDLSGLERLVEHLIAGGVHGMFVLGTTGEAPGLSHRLRHEMVRETLRLVRGRVPVLAGITDTSFVESVALAATAADAGAAAVVALTPYYFPAAQPELNDYLDDLCAELPLPLVLYNFPALSKLWWELPAVERAMQHPKIAGIKDSSGDMIYVHGLLRLARARPDWSVFVGPEELTAEAVMLGAHGGINAGANLFPALYVDLYHAAAAGDLEKVRPLHARVLEIAAELYTVGKHKSSLLKGVKCALSLLGICGDLMAEPLRAFREPERDEVRRRMLQLGLLPP